MAYAKNADDAAFTALYGRYEARLYAFFQRRLAPELRWLAPDLFQKTWLKVHGARSRFDAAQRFAPWLFSIALNTLRDEWRVPRVVELAAEAQEVEAASGPDDVERAASLRQDLARLERALSLIPEHDREALLLAEWEGFSSKELAQVLGVSEAAARQVVSRARRKARQLRLEGQE